jgi:drug/metabolite transporter (DMT)-like permease
MPTMFAAHIFSWYFANVLFNVGMKRAHAIVPDIMLLTTAQFLAAALALAATAAMGAVQPSQWWAWRVPLAYSSALVLCGTLCTNVSLIMVSVSFTHIIKTLEPLFTMAILWARYGERPGLAGVLCIAVTVVGVLAASISQRMSEGKGANLEVGAAVAMLANLTLQLRNILNQEMIEGKAHKNRSWCTNDCSELSGRPQSQTPEGDQLLEHAGDHPRSTLLPVKPLPPMEVLLVSLSAALPMQLALHAAVRVYTAVTAGSRVDATDSLHLRYIHYANTNPAWLIVPPLAFVIYQASSILVLDNVDPTMHAVLNTLKRVVVIGLGAIWAGEIVSISYVLGCTMAIIGASAH